LSLELVGLDTLQPLSSDSHAARRRGLGTVRRLTVVAEVDLEAWLETQFVRLGASGFTVQYCQGAGRHDITDGIPQKREQVRIESIVTAEVSEAILHYLQRELAAPQRVTICVETVQVARIGDFTPLA
jgi:hypothetical protein